MGRCSNKTHCVVCLFVCTFRHSQWLYFDIHSIQSFISLHSFAINACFDLIQLWKARAHSLDSMVSWFIYCIHALACPVQTQHTHMRGLFNKLKWNYIAICNAMHKYKLCHCTCASPVLVRWIFRKVDRNVSAATNRVHCCLLLVLDHHILSWLWALIFGCICTHTLTRWGQWIAYRNFQSFLSRNFDFDIVAVIVAAIIALRFKWAEFYSSCFALFIGIAVVVRNDRTFSFGWCCWNFSIVPEMKLLCIRFMVGGKYENFPACTARNECVIHLNTIIVFIYYFTKIANGFDPMSRWPNDPTMTI